MDKTFDAQAAEPRIYADWEASGAFAAGANASRPETFCIAIPPPNVTGSLHMGHALNNTLQDVLIRWRRMQGYDVLWQPGTDHAGIATQMVVERELMEAQQPGRREMGREAFVERVWEQKRKSEGTILGQLKRLGCSCDWSRTRFTMDEGLSAAVLKVFVDLYDKGLIFRGKRLVNWDPQFETAISDLEVENAEVDGHMWHFKYPLAGGATYEYVEKDEDGTITLREERDYISIATTRPETMLGDGGGGGASLGRPLSADHRPTLRDPGRAQGAPAADPDHHRRLSRSGFRLGRGQDHRGARFQRLCGRQARRHPLLSPDGRTCAYARRRRTLRRGRSPGAFGRPGRADVDRGRGRPSESGPRRPAWARPLCRPRQGYSADHRRGPGRHGPLGSPRGRLDEGRAPSWNDKGRVGASPTRAESDPDTVGEAPTLPLVEAKKIMQPFGDRSKVVIEPMLTDQWFVDAKTLAQPAIAAVHDGRTNFVPDNWARVYDHWMENIEPWCISRQLWWGHQIPVWYGPEVDDSDPSGFSIDARPFCAGSEAAAKQMAADYYSEKLGYEVRIHAQNVDDEIAEIQREKGVNPAQGRTGVSWFGGKVDEIRINRDPDVLDTWFSSALWPFSTLGWPDQTPELARYYKTDVLITGFDIIFFWVARMMMQGLEFMGEVPFHTVYINSIVVDKNGKKMSKSLGNILDPLELIDHFGADATRFALVSQEVQARRTLRMSNQAAEGGQRFGTKLWNAARFAEMNQAYAVGAPTNPPAATHNVNRWIIGETARAAAAVTRALDGYRFNEASTAIYDHIWKVFCDWYVEFAKPLLTGEDAAARAETRATMAWALDRCLILLHPIMPFITEELWGTLTNRAKPLIHNDWPDLGDLADPAADAEMGWVIRVIEGVRSVRTEMNVPWSREIAMVLTGTGPEVAGRVDRNGPLIERLARLSSIIVSDDTPEGAVTLTLEDCEVNLPLAGVIDIAAEKARLKKAVGKAQKEIKGLEGKLQNQGFLAKAPEEVVEEQRHRLEAARSDHQRLAAALDRLSGLA